MFPYGSQDTVHQALGACGKPVCVGLGPPHERRGFLCLSGPCIALSLSHPQLSQLPLKIYHSRLSRKVSECSVGFQVHRCYALANQNLPPNGASYISLTSRIFRVLQSNGLPLHWFHPLIDVCADTFLAFFSETPRPHQHSFDLQFRKRL